MTSSRTGGAGRVAVEGELDLATVDAFVGVLRASLALGPAELDLSRLAFIDSSGVRALEALQREAADAGWTFTIRGELQRSVRQVLDLTGMLELLPFVAAAPRKA